MASDYKGHMTNTPNIWQVVLNATDVIGLVFLNSYFKFHALVSGIRSLMVYAKKMYKIIQ